MAGGTGWGWRCGERGVKRGMWQDFKRYGITFNKLLSSYVLSTNEPSKKHYYFKEDRTLITVLRY